MPGYTPYTYPDPLVTGAASPRTDSNADSKPDYVLYNGGTRQTAVWYLHNNVFLSGAFGPTLPASWNIIDVADFDRDGDLDYALFNSSTHQTAIWYLSGVTFVSGAFGPTIASGYELIGTADFNGDGKPDYVLCNPGTGQTAIWYMNNYDLIGTAVGPALPAGWSLVATPTPPNNFLTGLYAYYKLDEASGAAMDSNGTRNLANFGNPIGIAAGKINTSRNFPGGNAYFSALNTTNFSPGSNHFFFSLWAKAGNLTQAQSDTGLLSKSGTASNRQWILYYKNTTRKATLNVSLDDAHTFIVAAATAFADTSTWYHIAGGWDGTNVKISVNGGPYVTTPFAGPVNPSGNIPFTIGLESGSGGGWLGQIDEVAVWIGRSDLTISEVQQLYNNGAGLPFSAFR
jgi:hypothetical protein